MLVNTFMLVIFLRIVSVLAITEPPQCRNSEGDPVDWWFIYKENNGMRYVYYDSKMAQMNTTKKHVFRPMSGLYTLDNVKNSPLLHTMYAPFEEETESDEENLESKPVFVAVNDQPAQKNGRLDRDAFKKPVSEKSGHVKFITAAQVEYGAEPTEDKATIYSYLIQHSLPRFPNMNIGGTGTRERIFANKLPSKANVFDANASSNGQHFMCMSFKDKQKLDDEPEVTTGTHKPQLKYRQMDIGEYLKSGNHHFICILHYLKVVHAVVVGTNYDPFDARLGVFHQYLNVYNEWSSLERRAQKLEKNDNMGRTSLARKDINYDSTHLCPMWPLNRRVRLDKYKDPESVIFYEDKKYEIFSMRSSGESGTGVCQVFDLDEPDPLCLASAKLVSTGDQYGIESVLLMKGRKVGLGPFDDLIAPLVVELGDYKRVESHHLAEPVTMNMGLITQSWIDNATFPISTKTLFNPESSLQVSLTLQNSAGVHLPVKDRRPHFMPSLGQDHSKWALAVPRESVGTFPGLFCTSDLNRTYKQEHRGGGMLCFSDSVFTELMLSLRPDVSSKFIDKRIDYAKLSHLYAGFTQAVGTAVKITVEDEEDPKSSPVFFLATQRTFETTCIHKMPYPFEASTDESIAIPDVSWGNNELKKGVQLKLIGDIKVANPKKPEDLEDLGPYYVPSSADRPPFFTGIRLKTAGITAAVVDGLLSISTAFWTHTQHLYHKGSGKDIHFTTAWLKDFFTSLPDSKAPAPKKVIPKKKK